MVELRPVHPAPGPVTAEELDWLAARRVGTLQPISAVTLVSRMRDEDWDRF